MDPRSAGRWRRIALDRIDSTNAEALRLAGQGDAGDLWVVARRQEAGRGRRGRPWLSAPGNLHATLLLVDPAPSGRLGQLPFVAGLALHHALAALLPAADRHRLTLKWPNDLLLDEKKVAGILIESATTGAGSTAVAIGCGVNCVYHPADLRFPATDLATAGFKVAAEPLFDSLLETFSAILEIWSEGAGFAAIRQSWLDVAGGIGRAIAVQQCETTVTGIFEALDAEGRLLLRDETGDVRRISAGDVFLLPVARREARP